MAGEAPGRAAESGTPASARFALWTLIALAAVSPWPFGSTPSWAVRSITWIALATALVVSLAQMRRGALSLPRAPLWPVAILVALGFMQLVPLPAGLHAVLAPGSAAVWHPAEPAAAALLGTRARPISIEPAATSSWLGLTSGVVAVGLLAAPALGRRRLSRVREWRGPSLQTECEDRAAGRNRDKLFSLAQITNRPSSNHAAGIRVPEFLPTGRVQRKELAFVGAPENEIARG